LSSGARSQNTTSGMPSDPSADRRRLTLMTMRPPGFRAGRPLHSRD
jgi:hypothetical protein